MDTIGELCDHLVGSCETDARGAADMVGDGCEGRHKGLMDGRLSDRTGVSIFGQGVFEPLSSSTHSTFFKVTRFHDSQWRA